MASHTVALVPGDGIGPETSAAMQRVVEASGADIVWDVAEAGAHLVEEHGTPLPASTIEAVKRNKVAIKGPVATPVGTGFRSVNVALRRELGLYACLRPVLSIPGAGGRYDGVDIVIVRENSEDLYAGIEFEEGSEGARKLIALCEEEGAGAIRPDSGISVKPISKAASERIVRFAFDYARRHGRRKVTAVHKANIMKHTDGLFLRAAREVAAGRAEDAAFEEHRTGREHRRRVRRVRSGARLGARHRGARQGQSHRPDTVGGYDARLSGGSGGGRAHPPCGARRVRGGRAPDRRHSQGHRLVQAGGKLHGIHRCPDRGILKRWSKENL